MRADGIKPDHATFRALMSAAGTAGRIDLVEPALKELAPEAGLAMNPSMRAALITALGKTRRLDRAFKEFERMTDLKIAPSAAQCCALIDACGKSRQLQWAPPGVR